MTQDEFKKIAISETEKYMGVGNILDLKNRAPDYYTSRKIYYGVLHIFKKLNGYPYSNFTKREYNGILYSARFMKSDKEFRNKVINVADSIKGRILKEQKL